MKLSKYQLHVIRCIVQFNRVHIQRGEEIVCPAIVEATRQLQFDWWLVGRLPYTYFDTPPNVRVMTAVQCASLLYNTTAPLGLVIDDLSLAHVDIARDAIEFVSNAHGKLDRKIVTINNQCLFN